MVRSSNQETTAYIAVSRVFSDGTMLETVYRPDLNETLFAIKQADAIHFKEEWQRDGQTLRPIAPTNNLLKHEALLLPSTTEEFAGLPSLTAEIEEYVRSYVVLSDRHLQVATAFVLLSWVYDAFNELPYLRFRGDYGSGKTRALLVTGSLCYKGFFASGASTVAPIFHTLDLFRGTLILDEADFRFTDEKSELVKILNNGNARGFPVLRMQANAKREFDPRAFQVFGPKIVAMRSSYEDRALESRFITVDMPPGAAGDAPINLPDRQRDEALALRNKLLMYRLRHRQTIRLDDTLADPQLESRSNQILLPLLSVAPTSRMREAIRSAARQTQENTLCERAESIEGQVLQALRDLCTSSGEPVRIAEIAATLCEVHGPGREPITNRYVGRILRSLGIELYKRNGLAAVAPGQSDRLKSLADRYGLGARPGPIDEQALTAASGVEELSA